MYRPNKAAPPRSRYLSLYAKLGVSPNASADAIRLAYQVLQEAYCPGGAYTDDAMQQSFSEIRNAAELLGNPKTRKLYDLGYIDEAGRQTEAGRAHASRFRVVSGVLLTLSGAAVLFFGFWGSPKDDSGGVPISRLQDRRDAAPAKETAALPQAVADPSPIAPAKAAAYKPVTQPEHEPAPVQLSSREQPPETASLPKNTPGAAPRSRSVRTLRRRARRFARNRNFPETGRKYAQRQERQRRPDFYDREPSSIWETDMWFPYRATPYRW